MLRFLLLFFGLLVAGSVARFLYGLVAVATLVPLMGREDEGETRSYSFVERAYMVLIMALSFYLLGLWAAFAAAFTNSVLHNVTGVGAWFSWFVAYSLVVGTFQAQRGDEEASSCIGGLIVNIGFVVFAIWPGLSEFPYGWALRLIGGVLF